MLSRKQISEVQDREYRVIDVPEWGGSVRIQTLSGAERDQYETAMFIGDPSDRKVNTKNIRARLCSLCLIEEDGSRMYSDSKSDLDELGAKNANALDRVFSACQELNMLGAKAAEEAEEN